ncbi:hypothetical protein FA13DRAFT_1732134 [Coprinellus micaceus]|uniref:Uncharacterized protein n=1 Tax=Coprinellus micaceus TaxID=71717 RepID=A0A4Y7TCH6_COPMI|nr:hypothetical protein FA13DRAFT_1732134 [Coprinellus micaceus]
MEDQLADPQIEVWGMASASCEGEEDVHMAADEELESLEVDETQLMDIEGTTTTTSAVVVLMFLGVTLIFTLDTHGPEASSDGNTVDPAMRDDQNSENDYARMYSDSSPGGSSSAPPSPTPSFVRVFGWCTCEDCQERARESTFYPPDVREEKLRQYDEWNADRRRALEQAALERKERYTTYLALRRRRALNVVGETLGLSAVEVRLWDEESYPRWWKGVESGVNRRASLGYEPLFSP